MYSIIEHLKSNQKLEFLFKSKFLNKLRNKIYWQIILIRFSALVVLITYLILELKNSDANWLQILPGYSILSFISGGFWYQRKFENVKKDINNISISYLYEEHNLLVRINNKSSSKITNVKSVGSVQIKCKKSKSNHIKLSEHIRIKNIYRNNIRKFTAVKSVKDLTSAKLTIQYKLHSSIDWCETYKIIYPEDLYEAS